MTLARLSTEQLDAATPEELALQAADCLSRLESGRQPLELFTQMARIATLATFEVTPFRAGSRHIEVLLGRRPEDDPWWPGQLHLPGNVMLPRKKGEPALTFEALTDGVLTKEFKGTVMRTDPVHMFGVQPRGGPESRGSELTAFAWAKVNRAEGSDHIVDGDFFDVAEVLADPAEAKLLAGHEHTLQQALQSYKHHERLPRRLFRTVISLMPNSRKLDASSLASGDISALI